MSGPTREQVLRLAREAGAEMHCDTLCVNGKDADDFLMRFAALVAAAELAKACQIVVDQAISAAVAAERIKHQTEIQRLTALANTAEKWRGIAMSRDGDGRTVQEVQEEARAAEREACAKVCEEKSLGYSRYYESASSFAKARGCIECADEIRARGAK